MITLMILGAGDYQVPLIRRACQRGYRVIAVSPRGDYPGFQEDVIPFYCNVRHKEKILEKARREKIQGITTDQTDIAVRSAAYVADRLNLPSIGYKTACLFTDKSLMHEQCEKLGIPAIKHTVAKSIAEATCFFDEIERAVIIKPADNQGSRGVEKISRKEDIPDAFRKAVYYSGIKKVLMEEYIEGREFFVNSVSFSYRFQNLICGDTSYFDIPGVFAAKTRIVPSNADQKTVQKVLALNKRIVTGFGLKQGLAYSEYIMDKDGKLYLIETAARGCGVFISSTVVPLQTTLQTNDFLIDLATGTLKSSPPIRFKEKSSGYMAFYLPPYGKVISARGVEKVKKLPYVHSHLLHKISPGLKTQPLRDKTARFTIVLSADSRKELEERMEYIRSLLHIKVQTEDGIKDPIWA